MNHSFDIDVAARLGINAAIVYENIRHWARVNKANARNVHDGYAWTYNSVKAYEEIFPYLSYKQIRAALKRLEDSGLIKSAVYNADPRDRTKWYTTEDGNMQLPTGANDELPSWANGVAQQGEPLPDINADIKHPTKNKKKTPIEQVDEFTEDEELRDALRAFVDARKADRHPVTAYGMEKLLNKLSQLASDTKTQTAIVNESVMRGWRGFFPLKDGGTVGANGVKIKPEAEQDHSLDEYFAMFSGE